MTINNYLSDRGRFVFFDDRLPPPNIPVGASVFRPLRDRPDVPYIIGDYTEEYTFHDNETD